MALAGAGSFSAVTLNLHARTNLEVIAKLLPVTFSAEPAGGMIHVTTTRPV
jgi:RNA 3'-terminal phosphate cyclase